MTSRQFLAYQSAKSSAAKFRRHRVLFAANEGLVEEVTKLDGMIERVTVLAREQAAASRGLTLEQRKVREELIATLVEVGGIGEGWAAAVGDEMLRARLTVTQTGLEAVGLRLEVVAPAILEAAREASAQGASRYGLTEAVLDDLAGQITRLVTANTVRDARDERKTVTQALSKALIELMTFLRDVMDPLMRAFQRREPRFFEEYRNSRRVGGRRAGAEKEETEGGSAASPEKGERQSVSVEQEKTETAAPAPVAADTAPTTTPSAAAEEGIVIDHDAEADAALEKVLGEKQADGRDAGGRSTPVEAGAGLSS